MTKNESFDSKTTLKKTNQMKNSLLILISLLVLTFGLTVVGCPAGDDDDSALVDDDDSAVADDDDSAE